MISYFIILIYGVHFLKKSDEIENDKLKDEMEKRDNKKLKVFTRFLCNISNEVRIYTEYFDSGTQDVSLVRVEKEFLRIKENIISLTSITKIIFTIPDLKDIYIRILQKIITEENKISNKKGKEFIDLLRMDIGKIKDKNNTGIQIYIPICNKQRFNYWDLSCLLYISDNSIAFYEKKIGLLSIVPISKINAYRIIYKN